MKIQSLSIVVPNSRCINNCKFCVSKMHTNDYENKMTINNPNLDRAISDYINKLNFARDNGCDTIMLTGSSEPQQNKQFLMVFGLINKMLEKPFSKIEMQTTGTLLDDNYLTFLRNHVGVTTVSISLSSFDDDVNAEIISMINKTNLENLCKKIKEHDFILRLSINLNDSFNDFTPKTLIEKCKNLGADQVTIRVLYTSENKDTSQDKWILQHGIRAGFLQETNKFIKENGKPLEILEYGQIRYNLMDMSFVLDDDSMSTIAKKELKYLILREDCRLYTKWDSKGSLLF